MKRLICMMLTLILLAGLIPAGAVTASAASNKTKDAAITVIKNIVKFQDECYQIEGTDKFRIGYATPCTKSHKKDKDGNWTTHTITKNAADKALKSQLKTVEKEVNSFASKNKLSLKQHQFDALVVYSYVYGTAWLNGNGAFKTAVLNKANMVDFMDAMEIAEIYRGIIANMYFNGVYSQEGPSNIGLVTYNANKGRIPQDADGEIGVTFDTNKEVAHEVTATRNGYKFLGWYDKPSGGKYYSNLRASCDGKDLYAYWQENGTDSGNINKVTNQPTANYTVYTSDVASRTIFDKPSRTGERLGRIEGDHFTSEMDYLSNSGYRWSKVSLGKDKYGWVQVTGSHVEEEEDNTKTICVTVTNSHVNMRENASIWAKKIGEYKMGDKLYIIKTEKADNFLWGEVANSKYEPTNGIGWVALRYTNWDSVKDNPDNVVDTKPDKGESASDAVARATVVDNNYVNLRKGAGTGYTIVGSIAKGNTVDIYEIKTVNGHQWGRTNGGWLCLTYTSVEMLKGNSDVSNEGSASYTFTGTYSGTAYPFVDATRESNNTSTKPGNGDKVSIITLRQSGSDTWAKIGWKVKENKKTVNKYGWVQILTPTSYNLGVTESMSSESTPVSLHTVKFTVVADQASVRKAPNSGSAVVTKLNKGYQFNVDTIKLVNADIWGKVRVENEDGWVNLASKYVKRADQVKDESSDSSQSGTGMIATIVNTDTVNVRADSKITAKHVGTLKRGFVANVLKERDGWYKLDVDTDNDPETSSWVYKSYVEVKKGSSSGGNINAPATTGTGIVANTYAGVNVRSGAGTSYPQVAKLLPGTKVEILETKFVGATRWGRMDKGWVSMDYITMITETPVAPPQGSTDANGDKVVGSLDEVDKTTTTAVYTGTVKEGATVYATTDHDEKKSDVIRYLDDGDPVTIYELLTVTEKVTEESDDEGNSNTTTVTSYWARVNDGYIRNPDKAIRLDALDEKTHTLTGSDTLNVRDDADGDSILGKLEKGDKVQVTSLEIIKDKVWGKIEYESDSGDTGWIRLDYMSEGAYTVNKNPTTQPTQPKPPVIGNTGNTGNGGAVNNNRGYRYTGKVINTDSVNVRSVASTSGSVTTTMKRGQALVIYETVIAENMAWGRCDAGWIYLYYVDLTPCVDGAIDSRVVYNDNTIIYTDMNKSETAGTYARMSVIDIYEIVDKMARTELGWVSTDDLLA